MDSRDEAEARQKVREMMAQPPQQRPPDFTNPLEKIEQLLTCPICLDRYKQPKLLPCQHTFCYPCLESCADSLLRSLKCPECRAEHNIPYEGVKAFQTNYTLTGFLDIHLQATPDTAAEIEEYVHRYNLERCKVCDEKADCEVCAHCDRKACKECRQTHMEMLKRDMSRLLNQVRRLSNRINEASDGLQKSLELLTLNCETTKDEVKEYFHRYYRDLKKREEAFIYEVEMFHSNESRLMSNLKDVLEIESTNMGDAVNRLDSAIKGECQIDDTELVRLKNIFSEGIEYLRNFQPDADELFSRKVRFSPGDDAAKLPQAISTAGELCVLTPQFSGRYLPLEQSYLPRPFRLPLESDHHRGRDERSSDRPSSRLSHRDTDESSIRYRRRQQLEDEAWNRLRPPSMTEQREERPVRSPWFRPPETSSLNAAPESMVSSAPASSSQSSSSSNNTPSSLSPPKPKETLHNLPPRPEKSPIPKTNGNNEHKSNSTLSTAKASTASANKEEDKDEIRNKNLRKPPLLPRQQSSNDDSLNEKVEIIKRAHAERQAVAAAVGGSRAPSRAASSDESEGEEAPMRLMSAGGRQRLRIVCRAASQTRDEDEGTPIPVTHFIGEHELAATSATGTGAGSFVNDPDALPIVPAWLARRRQRFQRSRTNPDLANQFCSQRVQQLLQERSSRLDSSTTSEEERQRLRRRSASRDLGEWRSRGRPRQIFGRKGAKEGELNWPRGLCSLAAGQIAVCDSSNHRVSIYERDGRHVRSFGGYGAGEGQLDSAAGIAFGKQRLIVSDRYNHRVCFFDLDGNFLSSFGAHGQGNGKFNNPWGVAIDDLGTVYVVDKDNHRVQMFDKNGQFVGKFGSHGHANGQLNNPLFVAVSKLNHQVYVSDSNNHRVCIFDSQGQYLAEFGTEGFHGGQFKFPRGIAIDTQGNVLVADSGNNRIQVFSSDGEFIATFGSWGSGAGQLKGVEALCVSDGAIIASDRENHRIQIF
ncbi:unnamed protein product [Auanema sp. JU1783]|nr:unnamed protein product [Auanema sp. JU1783]